MDVKERLERTGKKQVDLIRALRKKGYEVQPPALSSILNDVYTYPKALEIKDAASEIVAEWEREYRS